MAAKSGSPPPVDTCDCISDSGVTRHLTDMPPAHYTLKIDSYSQFVETLSKTYQTCYTSLIFEAVGYKWKLSFYPNGDEARNGKGYISLFLTIQDTKSLPLGWKVNVNYKFLVLDQIRNKYLSIQDACGRSARFDARKPEWGISQLLPYSDFHNTEKGFLIRDKCFFGAEISLDHCTRAGEKIAPVKNFEVYTYKWEVSPFSSSNTKKTYYSKIFTAGKLKWKLAYWPKGCDSGKGNSLSFFLEAVDLKGFDRVYAEFKLCIHDQCSSQDQQKVTACLFEASDTSNTDWGFQKFLSLTDLHDPSKGFLVKDKVIFEVEITNMFTQRSVF